MIRVEFGAVITIEANLLKRRDANTWTKGFAVGNVGCGC